MAKETATDQELRELLAELEYRKYMNPLDFYTPMAQQKKFAADTSKVKGILGGNRSGKTEEVASYVVEKCIAKPNQRWWCVAETDEISIDIQQRKIWSFIPKNKVKYCHYDEINGFRNEKIIFKNGSYLKFKTYRQGVIAFASDDLDGIWNDEEPEYDIYREQRMRLIDRNGEMIFSMTSLKGITDLIQEIFEDHDVIESRHAPLVDEVLPTIIEKDNMRFYFLWTTDNPYINQGRVQSEARLMLKNEIKSRVYGLPINLSGKIYMVFNKNIHVVPLEIVPTKNVTMYQVLDPHDRKPWAMKWIVINSVGTAWCVDEYPTKNFNEMLYDDKTVDEYATIIKNKEAELFKVFHRTVYRRIIDPNFGNATRKLAERQGGQSHTTIKTELRTRGLKYHDGIDALEEGHLKVREMLNFYEKDGELVMQPKYFIVEQCQNSIRHLSRYSRRDILATDGDIKDNAPVKQKYKDFCDLDRYFWMSHPKHAIHTQDVQAPTAGKCY